MKYPFKVVVYVIVTVMVVMMTTRMIVIIIIVLITRKHGNCMALQLEASRSATCPLSPVHPAEKIVIPKTALGAV